MWGYTGKDEARDKERERSESSNEVPDLGRLVVVACPRSGVPFQFPKVFYQLIVKRYRATSISDIEVIIAYPFRTFKKSILFFLLISTLIFFSKFQVHCSHVGNVKVQGHLNNFINLWIYKFGKNSFFQLTRCKRGLFNEKILTIHWSSKYFILLQPFEKILTIDIDDKIVRKKIKKIPD